MTAAGLKRRPRHRQSLQVAVGPVRVQAAEPRCEAGVGVSLLLPDRSSGREGVVTWRASRERTEVAGSGPADGGRHVCTSWWRDVGGQKRNALYDRQGQNLLRHRREVIRNLAGEQGAICQRGHKTPFSAHNTCNEPEGLGRSHESDFLPSPKPLFSLVCHSFTMC